MQQDHSLDDYDNDGRDSNMSAASVQKYVLNEKGMFRSKKTNFVEIANESKYDLIIVVEIDEIATHLADGKKIDKKRDGTPSIYTIGAGRTATLEIKTKISYFTALRRHPTLPGYFVIRSKKYLKRSSKWTATTKSVEKASVKHVDQNYLQNFNGINATPASSSAAYTPQTSQAKATGPRVASVDDEPRIPDNLREQLLKKESQNRAAAATAAKEEEEDKNSVEENGSDDGVSSSSGGQTHHLNINGAGQSNKKSSCCGCCCC